MKLRSSELYDIKKIDKEVYPLWQEARRRFGNSIDFFIPNLMNYQTTEVSNLDRLLFAPISITGHSCKLKCKHCGGKMLKDMYHATSPEELVDIGKKLKGKGAKGLLLTGGSQTDGRVDFSQFFDAMNHLKTNLGFKLAIHSGLINKEDSRVMADIGVDIAMIDIIGDDETIKDIYKLNRGIQDFEESLFNLCSAGIKVVPHLVIGLKEGKIVGEEYALTMIRKHPISSLVLVIFKPLKGTEMENVISPDLQDIKKLFIKARVMFYDTPLLLGCAKPWGKKGIETDILAVKCGFNGIAFPSDGIVTFSKTMGLEPKVYSDCCSFIEPRNSRA